jgi:imidazolonepropionase-like amidohydrolase
MKSRRIRLLLSILLCSVLSAEGQDHQIVVISGATLIDGTGRDPIRNSVIVIEGDRIRRISSRSNAALPSNATIFDANGKFVIPGLADMHNHLRTGTTRLQQDLRQNLARLLAFGVTTVFVPSISLKDVAAIRAATDGRTTPYPRFFSTGPAITLKGDPYASADSPTPETPEQARTAVAELKAAGVDAIKVSKDDGSWCIKSSFPTMKTEIIAAAIKEAHKLGLKVYAHAPMLGHANELLRAGADGLLHGIIDQPIDSEFISLMRRNRAVYVPTLSLFESVGDTAGWVRRQQRQDKSGFFPPVVYESFASPAAMARREVFFNNTAFTRERLPVLRANLKRVSAAGIPVVLGTDTGFFGVLLGVATQLELELMVESGLTPKEALRAATINAARMAGREKELGTVTQGKLADFLILEGNPLDDVRNVARITRVVAGGTIYEPAALLRLAR